jgi:hypothetical protein
LLERWRLAGRRETATEGARKLISVGFSGGGLGPLLADPLPSSIDVGAIEAGLADLQTALTRLSSFAPWGQDLDATHAWLAGLAASERAWAEALVDEAWAGYRDHALREFLKAHADDRGRASRLLDDA